MSSLEQRHVFPRHVEYALDVAIQHPVPSPIAPPSPRPPAVVVVIVVPRILPPRRAGIVHQHVQPAVEDVPRDVGQGPASRDRDHVRRRMVHAGGGRRGGSSRRSLPAASLHARASRPVISTFAPCSTKALAIMYPMPRDLLVISTFLLCTLNSADDDDDDMAISAILDFRKLNIVFHEEALLLNLWFIVTADTATTMTMIQ